MACKKGEIYNPKTKRCIADTPANRKRIGKASRKTGRKGSRKTGRKASRKTSRKTGRKGSRKASKESGRMIYLTAGGLTRSYPANTDFGKMFENVQSFFLKNLTAKEKKELNTTEITLADYIDASYPIVEDLRKVGPNKYEILYGT